MVRPCWTIRYAERSIPGGSRRGSPSTVSSTGSPAARTCSSSASSRSTPGGGASEPSATGSRNSPSMRRNSTIASRPVSWMVISDSRARSGALARTCSAAPAWSTITLTLCATASCISRAIRGAVVGDRLTRQCVAVGLEIGGLALELGGALPALAHPAPQQPNSAEEQPLAGEVVDAPALNERRDLEQQHERRDDHGSDQGARALAVRRHAVERDVEHDPRLQRAAHACTPRVA